MSHAAQDFKRTSAARAIRAVRDAGFEPAQLVIEAGKITVTLKDRDSEPELDDAADDL